jgi:hypothetical protein
MFRIEGMMKKWRNGIGTHLAFTKIIIVFIPGFLSFFLWRLPID